MFQDHSDAGRKLGLALEQYKDTGALVLAIPKGGLEVAYQVARHLNSPLAVIVTRKLPFPDEPEAGFGAVAEDGSVYLSEYSEHLLGKETINRILELQKKEIARRIHVLRNDQGLPTIENRTVILVDDGIATGSTVRASIMLCRNRHVDKIVLATPVIGPSVASEISTLVDELVVLESPAFFRAVAQVYLNWHDVSDEEAIRILNKVRQPNLD